ncbi:MAG: YebC/PmpR family DNA-binding transcriptional regulator [Actinomycetota bacterium]
MSGHSKWASIKHKKGATDAKRGALFSKLVRAITVAAKNGGGDPKNNAALVQAIDKAKENSMPAENIDRAIKRGTGELEGASYEDIVYEGYGPNGVAVMVEVLTDNRNRTASDIRNIFSKSGGSLGEQGCVNWMFHKKGVILVQKSAGRTEEEIMDAAIEGGAEDVTAGNDHFEILTDPASFTEVKSYLEGKGMAVESAEVTMFPATTVKLDEAGARKVLRLMDALNEQDDVQDAYANFDIPDDILETVAKSL